MHVGNEVLLRVVECLNAVPQGIELVGRELAVDRAPGDGILSGRLFDDETVNRRTTSAMTSFHNQRASIGQLAFTAVQRFFYQLIDAQVGVHGVVGLRHEIPHPACGRVLQTFCSRALKTTTAKKVAGLCQKRPKKVGPSCQNGEFPALDRRFTCSETF
ncbi:hypothetical protein D3C84_833760 [compost metagenome]